jgi:uncharacterized protein (DUF433 family)
MIVGQIGAGRSVDALLLEYPYLEREDILQALRYAAWRAEEREVVLADIAYFKSSGAKSLKLR